MIPRSILLTTFGSLGDLHPYLALGLGLKHRGHRVAVGTCLHYRQRVEAEGLEFRPIAPHLSPEDPEVVRLAVDPRRGTENIFRRLIMPALRESYLDTLRATEGMDLLVSHPIALATPVIAEQKHLPWASVVLSPMSFLSIHESMEISGHPVLSAWTHMGTLSRRLIQGFGRWWTRGWIRPLLDLRLEIGLPPGRHPLFEGQHSPHLVLALYSKLLGEPQRDWPAAAKLAGFCFHDRKEGHHQLSPGLTRFLEEGPPPVVFTLGSTAVVDPGRFYVESAAAAGLLGLRAVLLVGERGGGDLAGPNLWVESYAPYSLLFPKCRAAVCSGGIGTIGQSLRAGLPFLIVPHGNDQSDNAARCVGRGLARAVGRHRFRSHLVARELGALLADADAAKRAQEAARRIRSEDGVAIACGALENLLR